jgi:hypothetical protein
MQCQRHFLNPLPRATVRRSAVKKSSDFLELAKRELQVFALEQLALIKSAHGGQSGGAHLGCR